MNFEELDCPDFPEDEKAMIISTRIRVGRNLADFPLGPGISKDQRDEVEKIVSGVLTGMEGELAGTYYPLATMTKE
jgi:protein-arginine kinase